MLLEPPPPPPAAADFSYAISDELTPSARCQADIFIYAATLIIFADIFIFGHFRHAISFISMDAAARYFAATLD
jgi:hypothetical protein